MHQRFSDWLPNSAGKSMKTLVKSGVSENVWEVWCELLDAQASNLEIDDYVKSFSSAVGAGYDLLRTGCDLIRNPTNWTSDLWLEQFEALVQLVVEDDQHVSVLDRQLRGELGFLLETAFPEIKQAKNAGEKGTAILVQGLEQLLDGAGLPDSDHYFLLRPLLACWTRSLALGKRSGNLPWKRKSQSQYEWSILQTLRFTRKDLTQVFANSEMLGTLHVEKTKEKTTLESQSANKEKSGKKKSDKSVRTLDSQVYMQGDTEFRELLELALAFDSDHGDRDIAQMILGGKKASAWAKTQEIATSNISYFSDWSKIGILRSGWSHEKPALSVLYGMPEDRNAALSALPAKTELAAVQSKTGSKLLAELNFKSETIFSGIWDFNVLRNGKQLTADGEWTATCEVCEPTHDYLELEMPLSDGYRIQRHFFLSHEEAVAMIADSILPLKNHGKDAEKNSIRSTDRLEIESRIPLGPVIRGTIGQPHGMERVLLSVRGTKEIPLLRILPLGLPEWDSDQPSGGFSVESGVMKLRQFGVGQGIFAPLLFDLNPTRLRHQYTWRRLTVAESLEKVGPDRAAGFRIQFSKDQYLLYRSLTEPRNRTVFGHNLVSDLYFGKLTKENTIEQILDVEIEE